MNILINSIVWIITYWITLHVIYKYKYMGDENMPINSRQKGAKGERELANILKEYGYNTRRGQQYSGIAGEDVVGLDYIHIECKRVEKLNLENAMLQSKRDSTKEQMPALFHRKNNCKWLVTMELEDWIKIYNEYYSSMKLKERENDLQS